MKFPPLFLVNRMKAEPLKGEIYTLEQLRKMNQLDGNKELVFVPRLKSAVEWFRQEIEKEKKLPYLAKRFISAKIKEAFPDVVKNKEVKWEKLKQT